MSFLKKNQLVTTIVVIIVAFLVGRYVFPYVFNGFGGVTNYDEVDASALKIGGSTGTRYSLIASGTCTLTSDTSINATSTGSYTCATTGSLAGDLVSIGPLATTTTKMSAQYVIQNTAVAGTDTTTGTILNLTGAAGVPGGVNGYGSSTPYQIFRTTSTVPGL